MARLNRTRRITTCCLLCLVTPFLACETTGAVKPSADKAGRVETNRAPAPPPPTPNEAKVTSAQPEFSDAGVCARCHVVSVLEWGVTVHREEEVDCQECHGVSRRHVADERNLVKPDRVPHDEKIAKLCLDCHEKGCPETSDRTDCQRCHHSHALVNPEQPRTQSDGRLEQQFVRWETARKKMEQGERLVKRGDWLAARALFTEALERSPGNRVAQQRIAFCDRRIDPALPGFEILDQRFDPTTGLPRLVREPISGLEMVLIPPGTFEMGSDRFADSRPVHTVRIEPFYLSRYEVTQEQWTRWTGSNPAKHQGETFPNAGRLPVEQVSWQDGQRLIATLNERIAGGGFRLPTEAEWEYACRAGSEASFDPASVEQIAWFGANSAKPLKDPDTFRSITAFAPHPVGRKTPNAWGLYDMRGNVWEWCSSLWRPYVFDATDGRESPSAEGMRVLRGGGFADPAESLHPAFRHRDRPNRRYQWNGLRLARSVPKK